MGSICPGQRKQKDPQKKSSDIRQVPNTTPKLGDNLTSSNLKNKPRASCIAVKWISNMNEDEDTFRKSSTVKDSLSPGSTSTEQKDFCYIRSKFDDSPTIYKKKKGKKAQSPEDVINIFRRNFEQKDQVYMNTIKYILDSFGYNPRRRETKIKKGERPSDKGKRSKIYKFSSI